MQSPENAKFIAAYKAKFGADAVVTDPMVHGYVDVYLWKAAVEKAGSFDPAKVRAAAVSLDAIPTALGAVKFAPNNSLVQTALKLTLPGMPDIYQGAELWDLSLVDPDNRRPIDYGARSELLEEVASGIKSAGGTALPVTTDVRNSKS